MKYLRFYKYFNEIIIKCKKNMRDEEFTNENDPIVLITNLFEVNENILEMSPKKELTEKFISELQKGLNAASARINDVDKVASLQSDINEISLPNNIIMNWDFSIFSDNKNDNFDVNDYDKDFEIIQQQNQLKINNSSSMGLLLQFRMNNENQNSNIDSSSINSSNILGSNIDEGSDSESNINIQITRESISEISSLSEIESLFESNDCEMSQNDNESENNENISIGTSRSQIKRKISFKPKYIEGNMIIYKSSKQIKIKIQMKRKFHSKLDKSRKLKKTR